MTDKIRFGVVGCGRMGMRRIKRIVEHANSELICVADAQEEKAKAVGKEFGVDYYTDFNSVTNKKDIDCVVISVPNKFHAPISIGAMKNGKHIFCEKPMARNPDEGIKMVKASIENEVFLKVGSNLRYFPSVQKAKELLDNSAVGDVLFIRGWIGNAGWQLNNSWFSDIELAGGGTFLDNGCHLLDICRWFLGEVEECSGYVSRMYHSIDVEDNGFGIFKFMNGTHAFIQSSWVEWADYMYMEIYGTEGYIRVDDRIPNCKVIHGKRDGYQQIYDYSKLPPQSYDVEFKEYMKAMRNQSHPLPTGFDGLRAVQMAYGIYESSRVGKSVKIWGKEEDELFKLFERKGWC